MFSYISPADRVSQEHPLRSIRAMVDAVRTELSGPFERLYSDTSRSSIVPEQWLQALLRQVLDTVRRERLLMEQRHDTLLCRWFVGLNRNDPIWAPSTFSNGRERLREGAWPTPSWIRCWTRPEHALLSDAHCTVEGTLMLACGGPPRVQRQSTAPPFPPDDPGHPRLCCRGEWRPNATHTSTTEPEARRHQHAAGQEATLMEHRPGLEETGETHATSTAECEAALAMGEANPARQRLP
jgi:hypothetical protein